MSEKVAVVTGSCRGIGLAIIRKLAAEGFRVVVSDIVPEQEAQSVLDGIIGLGGDATYIRCDISRPQDRRGLIGGIIERCGRLDLVVNNAGVAPLVRMDILETTPESFERLMRINLEGTFFMCQEAANAMLRLKETLKDYTPRIVNISSISSYTASTNRGEYCVSKAGISMVTQLFADKLAEHGIFVFEARPGIIMTDMTIPVKEKYQAMIKDGVTPIRRFGQPEDVANCVAAAASGLLDFATGQVLNADGGFHIRRL